MRRIFVAQGRLPRTVTLWWNNVARSAHWLRVENSSSGRNFCMHSSLERVTNMSCMQCRRGGVRAVRKWKISSQPGPNYGPVTRNYQVNGLDELFFPDLNLVTPPPPYIGVNRRQASTVINYNIIMVDKSWTHAYRMFRTYLESSVTSNAHLSSLYFLLMMNLFECRFFKLKN